MIPLVPDHSDVRAGEWVVVAPASYRPDVLLDDASFVVTSVVGGRGRFPLSTMLNYYSGLVPLVHRIGSRDRVLVYRARRDGVPRTSWDVETLVQWVAERSSWDSAARAVPEPRTGTSLRSHDVGYADPRSC